MSDDVAIPDEDDVPESDAADKQVIVRVTEDTKNAWDAAAKALGVSRSEFIRQVVDEVADRTLNCKHPREYREFYPWQETCRLCGKRLRDKDKWLE